MHEAQFRGIAFLCNAASKKDGVKSNGARDRNRTGTPVIHEAADFKSDVSTNFTTRAQRRHELLEARSGVEPD
jgi:hypothetical protein